MLALNGGIRIWHISDVVDMRYGKYRLLKVIEEKHLNPFNGDAYVFCIYLYGVGVGGGSCRCQNRYGGFAEGLCGDGL